MEQQTERALRLAGICKKCKQFRFGYLLYGRGPFLCYQCADPTSPTWTPTTGATTTYFTFTTSNSSGTNSNNTAGSES